MNNRDCIFAHIALNPGATYSDLYQALKLSRPTLRKYIMQFEQEDLVRREGSVGRERARFFVKDDAMSYKRYDMS
jgi:predicted transcriptional regulator